MDLYLSTYLIQPPSDKFARWFSFVNFEPPPVTSLYAAGQRKENSVRFIN